MALYLKYRPQTFTDIVGQDHVIKTLQNSLAHHQLGHAYLFAGPRGTGKTSMARILAKAINCEQAKPGEFADQPCNQCSACRGITDGNSFDLIEIDAASHTGVDNIRDLKDKINVRPTQLKYKVYIIDEVHMLSKGAFNALLKTLEEPPEHAIFVLATTEPFNIPVTVLSRCQRFDFRFLSTEQIATQLAFISKKEKCKIEQPGLELIARMSGGALRDGISMLEQVISFGKDSYDLSDISNILGLVELQEVELFFKHLGEKDGASLLDQLHALYGQGQNFVQFAQSLIDFGRKLLLLKFGGQKIAAILELTKEERTQTGKLIELFDRMTLIEIEHLLLDILQKLKRSDQPLVLMELTVLQLISPEAISTGTSARDPRAATPSKSTASTSNAPKTQPIDSQQKTANKRKPEAAPKPIPESKITSQKLSTSSSERSTSITIEEVNQKWEQILSTVKPMNHSIEAFLKGGKPSTIDESGRVVIEFYYSFHKEQIEKRTNKSIVEDAFHKVLGSPLKIICKLSEKAKSPQPKAEKKQPSQNNDLVEEALKIFGGGTVVE